jgi:3D (Asp-Asp-Asp) domain-containing protein
LREREGWVIHLGLFLLVAAVLILAALFPFNRVPKRVEAVEDAQNQQIQELKQTLNNIDSQLLELESSITELRGYLIELQRNRQQVLKASRGGAWHQPSSSGDLILEATAYTAGYESTGKNPEDPEYGITKSGLKVDIGTVAVDPTVIPLGTVLWVEGYGYAVAMDTGSDIKGNRIDVFFHDLSTAKEWGRKKVRVKIIQTR